MKRRRISIPRPVTFGLCLAALLLLFTPSQGSLEITAYEYQRKFHKPLNLGECPEREVAVDLGNNSFNIEEQKCSLEQKGRVTHLPRELNDSRNVLISSPSGIVAYLGLCGGEAASFLGILHSGDCVAVEIASRLTFNEKTMVRAFVGYYRKSLDILDLDNRGHTDGLERYYKDKFYLKNRSYGTLEIIFVQFRFRSSKMTVMARAIQLSSPLMSDYMREIERSLGAPRSVTVINLSTATQETYKIRRFKESDWARAVRHVTIIEMMIQRTQDNINANRTRPHLNYQLFPFTDNEQGSLRLSSPVPWEQTSMLEVQLRQSITLAKKTSRKCRKNKSQPCRRIRELRRKLISAQAQIHKDRAKWMTLTSEEKNSFAIRYKSRVMSYSSVTENLAKAVRGMLKREKMETLRRKKNRKNQIPTSGRLGRRIRHSKRRRGRSRGKGRRNRRNG